MRDSLTDRGLHSHPGEPADRPAAIGLWQGVALYVCAILGAGVLVLPGQVASLAGPASIVAWGFSVVLSVPLAFTFANLATRFPDAGGVAIYARRAFGENAGGVAGWWYAIAAGVGQTIVPLTAGYYIADAAGLRSSLAPAFAAAILLVAVFAALAGLRMGGGVQLALAAGVTIVLLVAIVAAIPAIRWAALTPFAPHGVAGIGSAVGVLFYAFAGWEAVAHLAGDFRNVRKDLPRATLLTLFIVAVLYLGVAFAVVTTHSYGNVGIDNVSLGRIVGSQLGVSPAIAIAVAATVICLGTTNAYLVSVSRLAYSLGRDRWAPPALAHLTRRGTPNYAILAIAGLGAVGLAGSALFGWGISDLVYIPSTLVLATYLVGTAAGIRLLTRRKRAGAAIAFLLILCVTPSVGWHLVIPLLIAVAAIAYRRLARKWSTSEGP